MGGELAATQRGATWSGVERRGAAPSEDARPTCMLNGTATPPKGPTIGEHVPTIQIERTEDDSKGAFRASVDGVPAGLMTYSRMNDSAIIVDHTEVFDGFEGTGVGKQLVEFGVTWARESHHRIMPLCPFAHALFQRTPSYADVWFR